MPAEIVLETLGRADGPEFIAATQASHALHAPWVSPPATPLSYAERLARLQPPTGAWLAIRRADTRVLVGAAELSEIVRGGFQNAYLGYYGFAGQTGQGLMTAGLRAVARHAFEELGLHRLEANIQPGNTASRALARRCGFQQEGYSPRYLRIGGEWRDHERWALRAD